MTKYDHRITTVIIKHRTLHCKFNRYNINNDVIHLTIPLVATLVYSGSCRNSIQRHFLNVPYSTHFRSTNVSYMLPYCDEY